MSPKRGGAASCLWFTYSPEMVYNRDGGDHGKKKKKAKAWAYIQENSVSIYLSIFTHLIDVTDAAVGRCLHMLFRKRTDKQKTIKEMNAQGYEKKLDV